MRNIRPFLAILPLLLPLQARAADQTVSAAIVHFFKAANGTDTKDFAAVLTDPATITDTFAPFVWQGQGAAARYFTDLQAAIKAGGMSSVKLTPQPPRSGIEASRGFAYAPIPVALTFQLNGEAKSQTGMFVLGLVQGDAGWQVATATWLYTQKGS
jgi:ketosteroid isomerase-like protein